jgi:hypothetical protein
MPAPTALKKAPVAIVPADIPLPDVNDDDIELAPDTLPPADGGEMEIDTQTTEVMADEELRPKFAPAKDLVSLLRCRPKRASASLLSFSCS